MGVVRLLTNSSYYQIKIRVGHLSLFCMWLSFTLNVKSSHAVFHTVCRLSFQLAQHLVCPRSMSCTK